MNNYICKYCLSLISLVSISFTTLAPVHPLLAQPLVPQKALQESPSSQIQDPTEARRLARKARRTERRTRHAARLHEHQARHGIASYEPRPRSKRRYSRLECFGIGAADAIAPGVARAINGDYVKLASLDALNWASRIAGWTNADQVRNNPIVEEDVYRPQEDGSTHVHLDRSVSNQGLYSSASLLLTVYNLWDLYNSNCEANSKSARIFLAPFRFKHFYKNPYFYIPVGISALTTALAILGRRNSDSSVPRNTYFLYGDLQPAELYLQEFAGTGYATGIWEELLFRGILQKNLYILFEKELRLTPRWSRYLGIGISATLFGLAHTGAGFSARPLQAALFGVLFGFAYQPQAGSFDMVTPIAIHAWRNTLATLAILGTAHFERGSHLQKRAMPSVRLPLIQLSF